MSQGFFMENDKAEQSTTVKQVHSNAERSPCVENRKRGPRLK